MIEDEAQIAEMAKELLTDAGCETTVVHTGKAGIELASERKFDLITLDIGLPDMNGFEICRRLKEGHLSRLTPVVFISGQPSNEHRKRGLELGAVDFIAKPFDTSKFALQLLSHVKVKSRGDLTGVELND